MIEHDVRPLAESEFRTADTLFMGSLNHAGATDAEWSSGAARYETGRVWGDFVGGELAGTALSLSSALAVPGGEVVPAAAVTGVGVRADLTRRGVLTSLMRAQLDDVLARGEPVAMLHASETGIYGRFGYGVATRTRDVSLDTNRARLRPEAPAGGRVRLVDATTARKLLPEIHERIGLAHPGMIRRNEGWWETLLGLWQAGDGHVVYAVHSDGDDVDDGFAIWKPKKNDHLFDDGHCSLHVRDLQAANTTGAVELWRFLLEVDLADSLVVVNRPVDEPLEWWLADSRRCEVRAVRDDLWVRLVDVPTALEARTYGDPRVGEIEAVVLGVHDPFLPGNTGNYRIAADGAHRCDEPAQLSVGADMLGAMYLGDVKPSTLAAANRITVHDPGALAAADRLLTTGAAPWCGTGF